MLVYLLNSESLVLQPLQHYSNSLSVIFKIDLSLSFLAVSGGKRYPALRLRLGRMMASTRRTPLRASCMERTMEKRSFWMDSRSGSATNFVRFFLALPYY